MKHRSNLENTGRKDDPRLRIHRNSPNARRRMHWRRHTYQRSSSKWMLHHLPWGPFTATAAAFAGTTCFSVSKRMRRKAILAAIAEVGIASSFAAERHTRVAASVERPSAKKHVLCTGEASRRYTETARPSSGVTNNKRRT